MTFRTIGHITLVTMLVTALVSICLIGPSQEAQAQVPSVIVLGGPGSKVSMKSDSNLLFSSGGGHIEWSISGPVAVQLRDIMDKAPRDGNVSNYEANEYIGNLDRWIEANYIQYHGAKILRCSLMNHQLTTDTSGLISKVDSQLAIGINFIYDAAPLDDEGTYQMNDAIFVRAIFATLSTTNTTYEYNGEVELRHINTFVGLESFLLPQSNNGHVTHYVLPIVDYYDYSMSYSGNINPPIEKEDWTEYQVFDPMSNTIVVLVILIIMWVIIVNVPKWFASFYNKKGVLGLRGGLFGLIALEFIFYVLAWRYMLLYIIAAFILVLSCILSGLIYGKSKLAKDLDGQAKPDDKASQPTVAPVPPVPAPTPVPNAALPTPPPSTEGAIDDFNIEEIFFIYKDGRVITHCSVKGCDSIIEKDLVGSMLVAIHEFVGSSFRKEGQLDGFQFGDSKITVMTGNHGHLVIVLDGIEPPFLKERMAETIQKIEGMYAGIIEDWDGEKKKFAGINVMIDPLFEIKKGVLIKAKPEVVQVKSALEFYEGFLRLKVGVLNERKTSITDATFRLTYERAALRLSHVDPAFPMDGTAVLLGVIAPGEKKSLTFYLDPLTCQVTNIDGSATYRDYRGQFQTAIMKRRPAEIVCPIFFTPSTINVAMLKRLKGDLPYRDSRLFELSPTLDYQKVYSLAREAVLAHNVKLVKEFTEPQPFATEAWFYGQTAEIKEEMIIKVLVEKARNISQIWVASNNLATQTGLIAEIGNILARRIQETMGLANLPMPSTNSQLKEMIETSSAKLDTFQAEGEAPVADGTAVR